MIESIKGMKLNKGEWAEFYVMLKILGEGRLNIADKLLKKKLNCYLEVMKVIRQEYESQVLEYTIDRENKRVMVIIKQNKGKGKNLAEIPMNEFKKHARKLFNGIRDSRGSSVEAPAQVCDFAKVIYVSKPKAPALKSIKKDFGGKNDIIIEVRDSQTAIKSVMGFSIKSKFGENPTLFNAGSSSQFLYKLSRCTDDLMNTFNSISVGKGRGWSKCKKYLEENGIKLEFIRLQNKVYEDNLFLVRESMSKILAWCVKNRLIDVSANYNVKETVERMISENPFEVAHPDVYYVKAIKDFLMAGFTGMTAAKKWDGREQVNGGYIVVMDNGEVLCYHSNDRESFRDYLYYNTYFEYVDVEKYKWSRIRKEGEDYMLPLNISVRFRKDTRMG